LRSKPIIYACATHVVSYVQLRVVLNQSAYDTGVIVSHSSMKHRIAILHTIKTIQWSVSLNRDRKVRNTEQLVFMKSLYIGLKSQYYT